MKGRTVIGRGRKFLVTVFENLTTSTAKVRKGGNLLAVVSNKWKWLVNNRDLRISQGWIDELP